MSSVTRILTSDEIRILTVPQSAVTEPGTLLVLEAETLRAALFGELLDFSAGQIERTEDSGKPERDVRILAIPTVGLRLPPCIIRGALNLEDLCPAKADIFPPLVFDHCVFTEAIQLSRARIRRLSFAGSFVTSVSADNMYVAGPVDLGGVRSSQDHPVWEALCQNQQPSGAYFGRRRLGLCSINLSNSRIDGDVNFDGAHFVAAALRGDAAWSQPVGTALDLSNCEIRGAVESIDCFALGGISIAGARIASYVRLSGSRLLALEGPALDAAGAQIRGGVTLAASQAREGPVRLFQARGRMSFDFAHIQGTLHISAARLSSLVGDAAVSITSSLVEGDFNFYTQEIAPKGRSGTAVVLVPRTQGALDLSQAVIRGSLQIVGASLRPSVDGTALVTHGTQVYGEAYIGSGLNAENPSRPILKLDIFGIVDLTRAKFHQSLKLNGARILVSREHKCPLPAVHKSSETSFPILGYSGRKNAAWPTTVATPALFAVFAPALEVLGDCIFTPAKVGGASGTTAVRCCRFNGGIHLRSAVIKGALMIQSASIRSTPDSGHVALELLGAVVGSIQLRGYRRVWRTRVLGTVEMLHARINSYVEADGATFASRTSALRFANTSVGSFLRLGSADPGDKRIPFRSWGALDFESTEIRDGLFVHGDIRSGERSCRKGTRLSSEVLDSTEPDGPGINENFTNKSVRNHPSSKAHSVCSQAAPLVSISFGEMYALDFSNSAVAGNIAIYQAKIPGYLKFDQVRILKCHLTISQCSIAGRLTLSHVDFANPPERRPFLDLSGTIVEQIAEISVGLISKREGGDTHMYSADLSDARFHELRDHNGLGWGPGTRLRLDGFSCERLPHRGSSEPVEIGWVRKLFGAADDKRVKSDLTWLERQYIDPAHPTSSEFFPGVYDEFAKLMRKEGYQDESKRLLSAKFRVRRQIQAGRIRSFVWWLYEFFFDFGLSARRALCTFSLCIVVGWITIAYLNDRLFARLHHQLPVLVVSTATVATVAVKESNSNLASYTTAFPYIEIEPEVQRPDVNRGSGQSSLHPLGSPTIPPGSEATPADDNANGSTSQPATMLDDHGSGTSPKRQAVAQEIPCGRRIDPFLYALQSFVPALDLHQIELCEVSSEPYAQGWRWLRACYAILGWIVTSITVLTVPGILRSRAEE